MVKESIKLSPFKLINQNGEIVKFPNKKVSILFFYPKANTPGCTKEAVEFESNLKKIKKFISKNNMVEPRGIEPLTSTLPA